MLVTRIVHEEWGYDEFGEGLDGPLGHEIWGVCVEGLWRCSAVFRWVGKRIIDRSRTTEKGEGLSLRDQ